MLEEHLMMYHFLSFLSFFHAMPANPCIITTTLADGLWVPLDRWPLDMRADSCKLR